MDKPLGQKIDVRNLSFSYGDQQVLKDISLSFNKGKFYSIIGPNGSGKSTFIKNISKLITPKAGSVLIDNQDICKMKNKELAKMMAVIPQNILIDYDFTVFDIVMMGRSPYKRSFQDFNGEDQAIVEKYMRATNTWNLKDQLITNLSGGEIQRVIAARALSQEADIILLDEITSHLDIQYQIEFLNIFRSLKEDKIIIAVLHDLNLASTFSDEIILLKRGQVEAKGSPEEVISKENIKKVYNLSVEIFENPVSQCPYVIPIV
ncbi:MAG: cobalamin transport system ATP-binding protein [Epulopiscium sp.]|nr:transporter [Defluviitaleaceae bacterium]MDK2786798.1 cobalamin transport system ATP-binding protein [Candidatus Epulonipiscium sp.]HHW68330.1 ABC transporter ATP-binding protein [Candidatus Epulonipiscium sp.]